MPSQAISIPSNRIHFISCNTKSEYAGVDDLRRVLVDTASTIAGDGESAANACLSVERGINRVSQTFLMDNANNSTNYNKNKYPGQLPIIKVSDLLNLVNAEEPGLELTKDDVILALDTLSKWGSVIFFDDLDVVIHTPSFFSRKILSILVPVHNANETSSPPKLIFNGILTEQDLYKYCNGRYQSPEDLIDLLLRLNLCFLLSESPERTWLFPELMNESPDQKDGIMLGWDSSKWFKEMDTIQVYELSLLPPEILPEIVCSLLQKESNSNFQLRCQKEQMWSNGAVLHGTDGSILFLKSVANLDNSGMITISSKSMDPNMNVSLVDMSQLELFSHLERYSGVFVDIFTELQLPRSIESDHNDGNTMLCRIKLGEKPAGRIGPYVFRAVTCPDCVDQNMCNINASAVRARAGMIVIQASGSGAKSAVLSSEIKISTATTTQPASQELLQNVTAASESKRKRSGDDDDDDPIKRRRPRLDKDVDAPKNSNLELERFVRSIKLSDDEMRRRSQARDKFCRVFASSIGNFLGREPRSIISQFRDRVVISCQTKSVGSIFNGTDYRWSDFDEYVTYNKDEAGHLVKADRNSNTLWPSAVAAIDREDSVVLSNAFNSAVADFNDSIDGRNFQLVRWGHGDGAGLSWYQFLLSDKMTVIEILPAFNGVGPRFHLWNATKSSYDLVDHIEPRELLRHASLSGDNVVNMIVCLKFAFFATRMKLDMKTKPISSSFIESLVLLAQTTPQTDSFGRKRKWNEISLCAQYKHCINLCIACVCGKCLPALNDESDDLSCRYKNDSQLLWSALDVLMHLHTVNDEADMLQMLTDLKSEMLLKFDFDNNTAISTIAAGSNLPGTKSPMADKRKRNLIVWLGTLRIEEVDALLKKESK